MAKAQQVKAEWVNIDPASLEGAAAAGYAEYKAAYKAAKEARERFEGVMSDSADLPDGMRMIFGYNFGKLSVAIVPDDRKEAKPQARTLTLAEWMAQNKGR